MCSDKHKYQELFFPLYMAWKMALCHLVSSPQGTLCHLQCLVVALSGRMKLSGPIIPLSVLREGVHIACKNTYVVFDGPL